MTEYGDKALLPAGLQDLLPPDAEREAGVEQSLVACFAASGYERVKPPLMEFEETLLSGAGVAVAKESFRLMDPVSQRMMALRADITPQVARIAATRLGSVRRPLRLCYGGQVLRVRGGQLRPDRQFAQAGVELIGAPEEAADAEVVVLAASALEAAGLEDLSVDLSLPPLVPAITRGLELGEEAGAALRQALDRKDAAAVSAQMVAGADAGPGEVTAGATTALHGLLRATGPADRALAALAALALPAEAAEAVAHLARVVARIRAAAPALRLTVDPVEHRGFEYQTGISFTFFARGVRGELGRGGRYMAEGFGGAPETSTGFTLYLDTVLRGLAPAEPRARLYLAPDTPPARGRALRAEGWVTVAGMAPDRDPDEEARHLRCSHILRDDRVVNV